MNHLPQLPTLETTLRTSQVYWAGYLERRPLADLWTQAHELALDLSGLKRKAGNRDKIIRRLLKQLLENEEKLWQTMRDSGHYLVYDKVEAYDFSKTEEGAGKRGRKAKHEN